jgi:hypothetical protein
MKTSLRLLLATIILAGTFAAAVAPAAQSNNQPLFGAGTAPMPVCPPGGCDL